MGVGLPGVYAYLAGMQSAPPPDTEEIEFDDPPILGTWKNMYLVVLVLHTLLIICFYLISRAYTV